MQLSSAAEEDNTLEADDVNDSYFANDGHLRADENYETLPPTLPPNNNHGEYLDADNKAKHEPALTGRERRSLFATRSPQPKNANAYHASAGPKSRASGARSSHSVEHPPALPAAAVGPLSPHSPQLSPTNDFADPSGNHYAKRSSTVSSDWILSTDENGKRYRENTRTGEWYYV